MDSSNNSVGVKRRRVEDDANMNEDKEFTDQEAAVYDRQIRLWGVEAQKRLNNANILVVGLNGVGAEFCKNIILGGVKSVTLMDYQKVTELDSTNQFLAAEAIDSLRKNPGSVGMNRAAASLARAQLLNPMVNVLASSANPDDKSEQFFKDFTVICAIGCKKSQIYRLNEIARQFGIQFFAADVFGFNGYVFMDLGDEHHFATELAAIGKDASELSRIRKGVCTFQPFQNIVNVHWNDVLKPKRKNQFNKTFYSIFVILEFVEKYKRAPQPSTRPVDCEALLELRDDYVERYDLTKEQVPDELFADVFGQLGPVCALTGGLLSQEVVKAISHSNPPFTNFFVCNPDTETGHVASIYSTTTYLS